MKRSPARFALALLALVLIASGCSSRRSNEQEAEKQSGKYGSGVDLDFDKKKPGIQTAPPKKAAPGHPIPERLEASANTTAPPGRPGQRIERKAIDGGEAGGNAFFYLNAKTPELVVEMDAIQGMAPQPSTVSLLRQRLTGVVDKPAGIRFLPVETITRTSKSEWTQTDILNMEAKHRSMHNSPERAVMYILFLNGVPKDSPAIGIAYTASSDVIFTERIRGAASPIVGPEVIENATVIHEVGHLLALVNQTYKSPRPHEDPEHPGHSKNEDSVMYWAVDNVGVATLLRGRTAPSTAFDKDDLADLADLKSGKLG